MQKYLDYNRKLLVSQNKPDPCQELNLNFKDNYQKIIKHFLDKKLSHLNYLNHQDKEALALIMQYIDLETL